MACLGIARVVRAGGVPRVSLGLDSRGQALAQHPGPPQLAIVIFDSHQPGGWNALYMSAVAEQLAGAEVDEGIEIFSHRGEAQGLRRWMPEDVLPPARHRLFRATASEHFVLDPHDQRLPVTLT
jgi:hypothetical protein